MSAIGQAASRAIGMPLSLVRAIGAVLRGLACLALTIALLGAVYLAAIRDLPLFGVDSVEVVGTEDGLIISTLTEVAGEMTTLHVREDRLAEVEAYFPVVGSIRAEPSFPTGMRLVVEVREPVAITVVDGSKVPVAADGVLLPGARAPKSLPTLRAEAKDGALVGPAADQVRVIGATPEPLLALIESIRTRKSRGIAVSLEGGVEVRFGTAAAADRKWAAAAAVLADETLTGLAYVDVSAPDRPAVGGAVGGPAIEVEVDVVPATAADAAAEPIDGVGVEAGSETALQGTPETLPTAPESAAESPSSIP